MNIGGHIPHERGEDLAIVGVPDGDRKRLVGLVFRENKPEDVRTKAPGGERADEDVRVEKDPHDTSRLTSSSVR